MILNEVHQTGKGEECVTRATWTGIRLLEEWILRINTPFSDFSKETQNLHLNTRIRIWIFLKKSTLSVAVSRL